MNEISAQGLIQAGLYRRVLSGEFLNRLRTGILMFDADGIAIDCNRAAAELLDTEIHELKGRISTDMGLGAVREDGSPLPLGEHASAFSGAIRTVIPFQFAQ